MKNAILLDVALFVFIINNISPKHCFMTNLHGATSEKTFFSK
jgi:hypothetical protein